MVIFSFLFLFVFSCVNNVSIYTNNYHLCRASRLAREHHDDLAQFMLGMGYATEALHLPGISKRYVMQKFSIFQNHSSYRCFCKYFKNVDRILFICLFITVKHIVSIMDT